MGFELYTSKDALQAQVDDKEFFQAYHETVKKEGLYAKPEDLVAWYPAGGFVGRRSRVEEGGGKVVVSVSTLVCRDAGAVLGALRYVTLCLVVSQSLIVNAESSPTGSTQASPKS